MADGTDLPGSGSINRIVPLFPELIKDGMGYRLDFLRGAQLEKKRACVLRSAHSARL